MSEKNIEEVRVRGATSGSHLKCLCVRGDIKSDANATNPRVAPVYRH